MSKMTKTRRLAQARRAAKAQRSKVQMANTSVAPQTTQVQHTDTAPVESSTKGNASVNTHERIVPMPVLYWLVRMVVFISFSLPLKVARKLLKRA